MKRQQAALDAIAKDGQCKTEEDIKTLMAKYQGNRDSLMSAVMAQLQFYKYNINIPSVSYKHYCRTKDGKERSLDDIAESLTLVIEERQKVISSNLPQTATPSETIHDKIGEITALKKRLIKQAESEQLNRINPPQPKRRKKKNNLMFPDVINKRIRQRFEVAKSGRVEKKWFKGTVVRLATEEEMLDVSDHDFELSKQGYQLFMVEYDNFEELEPYALQVDWENGDLQLI